MTSLANANDVSLSNQAVSSEPSDLGGLYVQAQSLVARLQSTVHENFDETDCDDEALSQLSELSATLVNYPANTLEALRLKVMVYRAIASETPEGLQSLPIDEQLLYSLVADIERLSD